MTEIGTSSELVTLAAISDKCVLTVAPSASVARHIYLRQGVGVGGLKKIYGGIHYSLVDTLH